MTPPRDSNYGHQRDRRGNDRGGSGRFFRPRIRVMRNEENSNERPNQDMNANQSRAHSRPFSPFTAEPARPRFGMGGRGASPRPGNKTPARRPFSSGMAGRPPGRPAFAHRPGRNARPADFSRRPSPTGGHKSRSMPHSVGILPHLATEDSETIQDVYLQASESGTPREGAPVKIPPPGDNIRIIPLGGVEEIGKNMTAIEFRDDIIVIDAGFQFREDDTPGIDYILPNTTYLEERKEKIRALIVTHGHLDHIGAIPYVMEKMGNPPIYSRLLTTVMIKKRQEEFPHVAPLDIRVIEKEERITLGSLSVSFFAVSHTIPDSMGVIVETPYGDIVHTGDIRVDNEQGVPTDAEVAEFDIFKNRNVLCLITDSTNVERPGWQISERVVVENIDQIIREAQGRLIIGTFASQLERIIKMIEIAQNYNKKVVIEGRSMKINVEIIKYLNMLKVHDDTLISADQMQDFPPDRIVAIVTGAQADEFAALARMSVKNHKYFKITPSDTILLSSSIIPGNERAVQKLKDNLSRQGARIIHYRIQDVHASGHANRDEMMWVHSRVNPRFFIPVHGYHHMLRVHAQIAYDRGLPKENVIIPDNGMIIEIVDEGKRITTRKEMAPNDLVLVDGFFIGEIQEVVIRDRQMLAKDGMFVVIASINPKTGKLRKSPDIISRGFVYMRESQDLLQRTRTIVKKTVEDSVAGAHPPDLEYARNALVDNVSRFLFQQTNKRPIVIPVLIGV